MSKIFKHKDEKCCVTCNYWTGERELCEPFVNHVRTEDTVTGTCLYSNRKGSVSGEYLCSNHNIWEEMKDSFKFIDNCFKERNSHFPYYMLLTRVSIGFAIISFSVNNNNESKKKYDEVTQHIHELIAPKAKCYCCGQELPLIRMCFSTFLVYDAVSNEQSIVLVIPHTERFSLASFIDNIKNIAMFSESQSFYYTDYENNIGLNYINGVKEDIGKLSEDTVKMMFGINDNKKIAKRVPESQRYGGISLHIKGEVWESI